jgi:amino acid transporter
MDQGRREDQNHDLERNPATDFWVTLVILGRVVMILVLWVTLFVAIFLGYFTLPVLLIGLVTVIYMISDFGLYMTVKKRQQRARQEREALLKIYSERSDSED